MIPFVEEIPLNVALQRCLPEYHVVLVDIDLASFGIMRQWHIKSRGWFSWFRSPIAWVVDRKSAIWEIVTNDLDFAKLLASRLPHDFTVKYIPEK